MAHSKQRDWYSRVKGPFKPYVRPNAGQPRFWSGGILMHCPTAAAAALTHCIGMPPAWAPCLGVT